MKHTNSVSQTTVVCLLPEILLIWGLSAILPVIVYLLLYHQQPFKIQTAAGTFEQLLCQIRG